MKGHTCPLLWPGPAPGWAAQIQSYLVRLTSPGQEWTWSSRHESQHKPPALQPLLQAVCAFRGRERCSGPEAPTPRRHRAREASLQLHTLTGQVLSGPAWLPRRTGQHLPLGASSSKAPLGVAGIHSYRQESVPLDPPPPLMPLPGSLKNYNRPDPTQTPFFHLAGPCLPLA